jgi:hypothetical protein
MLTVALIGYKSYGISWDERAQREIGTVSTAYILGRDDRLLGFVNRDYGVAFEVPLIIIEKVLDLQDTQSIYQMRHLATHVFFLVGAVFLFKLIDAIYKDKRLATAGFLMLVLNPVLYAHSFFNSKDIPFMSMFIICLYLSHKALTSKKYFNYVLLGIASGLLVNLRIMGVILPIFTVLFLAIKTFKNRDWRFGLLAAGTLGITSLATLYVTWPFLWINPIENFLYAFHNMSKFRWDGMVLFNGQSVRASQIPWYYAPVWFFITTPLTYIVSGVIGISALIWKLLKKPLASLDDPILYANLMFMACFAVPLISVIGLGSVLYDSWRQLFFIYPSFVMLAVFCLNLVKNRQFKWVIFVIFGLTYAWIGTFMVINHPFQQAYFNETLSLRGNEYIRKNFEMDYWCVAAKQSLEHILKNDNSTAVKVTFEGCPGAETTMMLKPADRARVIYVAEGQADYLVTSYRFHPQDYSQQGTTSFFKVKVLGNTINEVFKYNN